MIKKNTAQELRSVLDQNGSIDDSINHGVYNPSQCSTPLDYRKNI